MRARAKTSTAAAACGPREANAPATQSSCGSGVRDHAACARKHARRAVSKHCLRDFSHGPRTDLPVCAPPWIQMATAQSTMLIGGRSLVGRPRVSLPRSRKPAQICRRMRRHLRYQEVVGRYPLVWRRRAPRHLSSERRRRRQSPASTIFDQRWALVLHRLTHSRRMSLSAAPRSACKAMTAGCSRSALLIGAAVYTQSSGASPA